jgi:hypothetical protein
MNNFNQVWHNTHHARTHTNTRGLCALKRIFNLHMTHTLIIYMIDCLDIMRSYVFVCVCIRGRTHMHTMFVCLFSLCVCIKHCLHIICPLPSFFLFNVLIKLQHHSVMYIYILGRLFVLMQNRTRSHPANTAVEINCVLMFFPCARTSCTCNLGNKSF